MPASELSLEVEARCPHSHARACRLTTPRGTVRTPFFMPVGTRGTVKGLDPRTLAELGSQVVLANTYHLHLRPGEDVVRELGGLHRFMAWDGPILTDSGGYQVFSLGHIAQVDDAGVRFKSIVDGSMVELSPERATDVQLALGADWIMAFDQCPATPLDRGPVEEATARTHRWLDRCVARWRERGAAETGSLLFGIVQGGAFEELRHASVEHALSHDLPGYAVGGVSVGEHRDAMRTAVEASAPRLPEDRPRYLMGVGMPLDMVDAVMCGIDMFDCVTPTRHGRTHQAFTTRGRINVRNRRWQRDPEPLDPECGCPTCARFSRGYLRHLCTTGEMLGPILLTAHNLWLFHRLLADVRVAVEAGTLPALRERVAAWDERGGE